MTTGDLRPYRSTTSSGRKGEVHDDSSARLCWYTTENHPRGLSPEPSFEVVGSIVYPGAGHPAGTTSRPWYQLRDGFAYPVDGHPGGPSAEAAFRLERDLVYPAGIDPVTFDDAWFEIRPAAR